MPPQPHMDRNLNPNPRFFDVPNGWRNRRKVRNPNSEIRKKSEARNPKIHCGELTRRWRSQDPSTNGRKNKLMPDADGFQFRLRISCFFRISDFVLRIFSSSRLIHQFEHNPLPTPNVEEHNPTLNLTSAACTAMAQMLRKL